MNLSPEVEAYLAKAHHALEVAWKLQAEGELADAAGKAYYAMFYAAQALLRAHGIEVVKHSAVASQSFNEGWKGCASLRLLALYPV